VQASSTGHKVRLGINGFGRIVSCEAEWACHECGSLRFRAMGSPVTIFLRTSAGSPSAARCV